MSDVIEVVHPNTGAHPNTAAASRADDERLLVPGDRDPVITDRRPPARQRAHDLGQLLRGMFAGVILAAIVALGIDNRQDIAVSYVFDEGTTQLWVLLAVAAVGGMLFGWLVAFRSHRTK